MVIEARSLLEVGIAARPVALADKRQHMADREVAGGSHAIIESRSALQPVDAGEPVGPEQVGVVEFDVAAVFIWNLAVLAEIRPESRAGHRVEEVRTTGPAAAQRQAPFHPGLREKPAGCAVDGVTGATVG